QHDYVVNINLAWQAWTASEFTQMRHYLEQCLPAEGEDDLRGFEWHYLWKLAHNLPPLIGRHTDPAYHVELSPDGTMLATTGPGGVRVWRYPEGEEIAALGGTQNATSADFHPSDRRLVTTSNGQLKVWELETWQ